MKYIQKLITAGAHIFENSSNLIYHDTCTNLIPSMFLNDEFLQEIVTPHGETHKKSLNPNPRYSQFSTNGVLYRPLGFFTDYSSRMFISQFPANKITEIDLEVSEKVKFRAPFCSC